MEQWRGPIVDSLVMKLINNNLISISDFTLNESTGGYYLSRKANNAFIKYYEEKIRSKNSYFRHANFPMSFRYSILFNIYELVRCLEDGNLDNYKTLTLR